MRFHLEQQLPGSGDDVMAAFTDPAFYARLADLPNVEAPEFLGQEVGDGVVRQRIRYRFSGRLSGAVTAVVDPDRLTWIDETTYELAARSASFRIVPEHYASKLSCSGSYRFVPAGEGTKRVIDGELRVHVPLVGRRVEGAIVSGLERHLEEEAALVASWLTDAGGPKPG